MSLDYKILGGPGRDNALWVRVDSGQSVSRLLFDCGAGCLTTLGLAEILAVEQIFFSHLHMDHVSGFDSLFRCLYNRNSVANEIWGPPQTSEILQHRFQGFWWNLIDDQDATWRVCDVHPDRIERYHFELSEAFSARHHDEVVSGDGPLIDTPHYYVESIQLRHHGTTLGYRVCEKPRQNINIEATAALGLHPGPWMQTLKDASHVGPLEIDGNTYNIDELRTKVMTETAGESIAYLTDFLLDEPTLQTLVPWLSGCQTIVCEAQYRREDIALAAKYHHATTEQVSRLAAEANVETLLLFHLSDRYERLEWSEMLAQCRANFTRTYFPSHWNLS